LVSVISTCGGRKIRAAASKNFAVTLGPKGGRVQAIIEQRNDDGSEARQAKLAGNSWILRRAEDHGGESKRRLASS
jgi:hypothetical protein